MVQIIDLSQYQPQAQPQPQYAPPPVAPAPQGGSVITPGNVASLAATAGLAYGAKKMLGRGAPKPTQQPPEAPPVEPAPVAGVAAQAASSAAPSAVTDPVPDAAAPPVTETPFTKVKGFGIDAPTQGPPAPDPLAGRIGKFVNQAPAPTGLPPTGSPTRGLVKPPGVIAPPTAPTAPLTRGSLPGATPEQVLASRVQRFAPSQMGDIAPAAPPQAPVARGLVPPVASSQAFGQRRAVPDMPTSPASVKMTGPGGSTTDIPPWSWSGEPSLETNSAVQPQAPAPAPRAARVVNPNSSLAVPQSADDAAQIAAANNEGMGGRRGSFWGDESGLMKLPTMADVTPALRVGGKIAAGVGGAAALAEGVGQNGIIPLATGQGLAATGQSAVRNAGPLAGAVEPAMAHMVANSIKQGDAPFFTGAKAIGAGAVGAGARLADMTGIPGAVSGVGGYLAHGLGLDHFAPDAGGPAVPAVPPQASAKSPVVMNGDGSHSIGGQTFHPSTHSAQAVANAWAAQGYTLGDLAQIKAAHAPAQQIASDRILQELEARRQAGQISTDQYLQQIRQIALPATALPTNPDGT